MDNLIGFASKNGQFDGICHQVFGHALQLIQCIISRNIEDNFGTKNMSF